MINLDDKEAILESQGGDKVLISVDGLQKQLEQSFNESLAINFPQEYQRVQNVVVCGMGGSRFPPLIIKELFKEKIKVPYLVNDDYNLPGFVDENALVILSSYSGTTEEVISCGKTALERRAKLTGITSGAAVASFLRKNGLPVYVFSPIHNPSGQPRIGAGYMVGGHLGLMFALGLLKENPTVVNEALKNAVSVLEEYKITIPKEKNPAKQLAEKLYQRYPYYVVSEFLTGVGNAIANQTNETAKAISAFQVIPELNHHLMEGLKFPDKLNQIATFVFFYSDLFSPPIKKRFQVTKEVVEKNNIQTIWYELRGKSKVDQTFELMGLGSYTTMYLAALYGQNPAVIPYVDYFKKKLKEMP